MAATVQLNIQTNEAQVRTQLQGIQQQLNQLTSRSYNIHINAQLQSSLTQQLTGITTLLRQIRNDQNLHINVSLNNAQSTINALGSIENSMQRVSRTTNTVTGSYNALNQTINNYNRQQRDNIQQNNILIGALRSLGHILVHEVRAAFNSALTEMKNVDTELITIQKVTNESAQGMKRYADDAYEVAAKLGAGASEYLNAVAEFAKAGYGKQSKELGELAITAAKVGDTTQQMANQFLLSVDAAYQYKGSIEDLTAVLDGANEIGNRFPTSVQKIAEGLGKVSPIAAQAHVGIDELTAAIGTITAVTQRSGTEAATALRALYLNIIGDTKTEIEDGAKWTAGEIEGLRDLLKKYAGDLVKAADETGKVINPMEAVRALYLAMREGVLTEQELMQQVSDIGGKLRSSQLLALIQNFGKYEDMLKAYRDSAGSAAEEYAIYLNSWEAKTKQLSATWTDFVQNKLGTQRIKDLLDVLIKVVKNLDDWTPLIKSIGAAIVMLNLPQLTAYLGKIVDKLKLLRTNLGATGIAAAALVVAYGAFQSILEKNVTAAEKQAKKSADVAEKAEQEATAMMRLAAELGAAKEGSDEYVKISGIMQQALQDEGIAVTNLAEDYRELTRSKLESAQTEARNAMFDAGLALRAQYQSDQASWTGGSSRIGTHTQKGAASFTELDKQILSMFESSSAAKQYSKSKNRTLTMWYGPSETSSAGIAEYYMLVRSAIGVMNDEVYKLVKEGNDDAAEAIRNSTLYKDLNGFIGAMGDAGEAYVTASEKYADATTAYENIGKYYDAVDWLNTGGVTQKELSDFLFTLDKSNEYTETQKNLLRGLITDVYPQWAKALGLVEESYSETADAAKKVAEETAAVTSALEKFQAATKKGSEKDDPFKSYKDVYDTVIKEGKKGRYGSNAFQYGIQALLDPDTIEKFKGDWAGLVTYMQTSLGGLYKDGESMGTGLLDKIVKGGEKVSKSLYEMRDENGKLLASFDKKSGAFRITEDPEGIKILSSKLGMSAESLIAAAIGLGAIDPNANAEGLKSALDKILGRGEGEEDPIVAASQTIADAAEKDAATAETNSGSATTFANAVDSFAEIMAAEARAHDEAEKNRTPAPGNGPGVGGSESSETGEGTSGPSAHTESSHGSKKKSAIETIIDKVLGGGEVSLPTVSPTPAPAGLASGGGAAMAWIPGVGVVNYGSVFGPTRADFRPSLSAMISDPMRAAREGGTNLHPSIPAGALDSANARIAAFMGERYGKPSEVSEAVAEGVEQGIAQSNKDSAAYHSGNRGGIPFGDFNMSQYGTGSGTGNVVLDFISGLLVGGSGKNGSKDGSGAEISLSVDNTEAQEKLEETQEKLEEIDNTEAEASATIDPSQFNSVAEYIEAKLDQITQDRKIRISIEFAGGAWDGPHDPGASPGLMARPMGDEYFHGGPVLVNDEAGGWNPELIVANGRAFIANGGDPAVIRLPRGARIFTADETRDIFQGGGDLINLPAFADGFYEGSVKRKKPKGTGTKSSASSGSSGSSGGGSTAFTDDMMKKLEQYMSEILDAAEDALNDQLEAINAQIYALKYQTEAAEKATALEEARLELLEAEKNLLDANTERTVRYYNAATGQWEWMADQREVMRAQEELYDAQKNLLEAEYDALATAWNELKDEIAKALENNEEIDINAILKALGKSAAKGSLPGLKSLIGDIGTYTDDPRAWANFDGGGLAHGVGWMPKGSRGTEAVLDANLTRAILNPQQNAAFTNFTDSLSTLFSMAGGNGGLPSSRFSSNVSNLYGGNTYIEGVRIGSDMMNRPLSEVLSTLNLYKNN